MSECKWVSHEMFSGYVYVKTECGVTIGGNQTIPEDGEPCPYCKRGVQFEVGEDDA